VHKFPIAIAVFLLSNWCGADDKVDEVVVEAPRTAIETELRNFGVVRVRYRASTANFDEIAFIQKTQEIPPYVHGFGVELAISSNPRRRIRVAEVWSHPNIRHRGSSVRRGYTMLSHTLEPPDVYSIYFPLHEYSTTPAGDWTLQLYVIDERSVAGQNIESDDDPEQLRAKGVEPFFEYQFQVLLP